MAKLHLGPFCSEPTRCWYQLSAWILYTLCCFCLLRWRMLQKNSVLRLQCNTRSYSSPTYTRTKKTELPIFHDENILRQWSNLFKAMRWFCNFRKGKKFTRVVQVDINFYIYRTSLFMLLVNFSCVWSSISGNKKKQKLPQIQWMKTSLFDFGQSK